MRNRPLRKRNLDGGEGKTPPSYANVARREYREDLCYAVIDTSSPTEKIPEAQRRVVGDAVKNATLGYVMLPVS